MQQHTGSTSITVQIVDERGEPYEELLVEGEIHLREVRPGYQYAVTVDIAGRDTVYITTCWDHPAGKENEDGSTDRIYPYGPGAHKTEVFDFAHPSGVIEVNVYAEQELGFSFTISTSGGSGIAPGLL